MKMEGFEMELLRRLSREYLKATKRQKTGLIKQYSSLTGVRKETARKRFNRYLDKQYKSYTGAGHGGRRREYDHRHEEVVKRCWQLAFEICAEKRHMSRMLCLGIKFPVKYLSQLIGISLENGDRFSPPSLLKPLPLQKQIYLKYLN